MINPALDAGGGRVSSIIRDHADGRIPEWSIEGKVLAGAKDFAELVQVIRSPDVEMVKVAVLDGGNKVVWSQIVSVGTVNEAVAHQRDLLRALHAAADKTTARRLVVSHNHPSGDPRPSAADIDFTLKLQDAARVMDFEVVDHVITNGEKFYSLREAGYVDGRLAMAWEGGGELAGKLAPWEAAPRSALRMVEEPRVVARIAKALRQGDPQAAHVLYLNTRLALTGLERVPEVRGLADAGKLRDALRAGVGREAAYALAVDFGGVESADDALELLGAVREMSQVLGVRLVDASSSFVNSYRVAGYVAEGDGAQGSGACPAPGIVAFAGGEA